MTLQDRPWNDPGPRRGEVVKHLDRPALKAIILDFSSVNNVDITSVQHLIDGRNQLDKYATPEPVDWHFACIQSRWTKRALASAGFGYPSPPSGDGSFRRWKPVFSVAEIGGHSSAAAAAEDLHRRQSRAAGDVEGRSASSSGIGAAVDRKDHVEDISDLDKNLAESKAYLRPSVSAARGGHGRIAVVQGLNRPLFHVDLTSALQSAIANVERREIGAPKTVE